MLLIYQNPAAFEAMSERERHTLMDEAGAIVTELSESGEWVTGEGLAHPSTTTTVRVREGVAAIQAGIALVTGALREKPLGPVSAASACRAAMVALYELLERSWPNPMVTLNHAVAVAMLRGPQAGLDLLDTLAGDERIADNHRLDAVRGHLLEMAGDHVTARSRYQLAARRTTSLPERRYLEGRAARLTRP
jgi:predicted RNA polymerase sigma factor